MQADLISWIRIGEDATDIFAGSGFPQMSRKRTQNEPHIMQIFNFCLALKSYGARLHLNRSKQPILFRFMLIQEYSIMNL